MKKVTREDIAKAIINVSNAHAPYDIFFDFIQCAAMAFANSIEIKDSKPWREIEDRYMSIVKKYEPDEFRKFGDIMKLLIDFADQRQGIHDVIGPIFEGLGMGSKQAGQFFTPEHIAYLMARISLPESKIQQEVHERGHCSIYEPTCGAGVNLLMGARVMLERGYNPQKLLVIHGADIDFKCVCMTYLQLSIYHIPGVIQHQDTLEKKVYSTWMTPAYVLGGWEWREVCQTK